MMDVDCGKGDMKNVLAIVLNKKLIFRHYFMINILKGKSDSFFTFVALSK